MMPSLTPHTMTARKEVSYTTTAFHKPKYFLVTSIKSFLGVSVRVENVVCIVSVVFRNLHCFCQFVAHYGQQYFRELIISQVVSHVPFSLHAETGYSVFQQVC